jgi:hypothetical protein
LVDAGAQVKIGPAAWPASNTVAFLVSLQQHHEGNGAARRPGSRFIYRPEVPWLTPDGRAAMITATYPDASRKLTTIKKTVPVCPVFGDDFSPAVEFSAYMTAKSPSGGNST